MHKKTKKQGANRTAFGVRFLKMGTERERVRNAFGTRSVRSVFRIRLLKMTDPVYFSFCNVIFTRCNF